MHPAIAHLHRTAHSWVVAPSGLVYKVRRITSRDLLAMGYADLLGASDADAAVADIAKENRRKGGDPAVAEEAEQQREANAAERLMRKLQRNPDLVVKIEETSAAWCAAGVVELGAAADGVAPGVHEDEPPLAVSEGGETVPMEPFRIVMTAAETFLPERDDDGNPVPGQPPAAMHYADIPAVDRGMVAHAVAALSGAREVRPFRRAPRAADPV